jgi:hypothetical protein
LLAWLLLVGDLGREGVGGCWQQLSCVGRTCRWAACLVCDRWLSLFDSPALGVDVCVKEAQATDPDLWTRDVASPTRVGYLGALTGKGVHVVTVNDYLAARDAAWWGENE